MSGSEYGHTVETRDRLRLKLDILGRYDRVLRAQLDALEEEDLERFSSLGEERDLLGDQLVSVDAERGESELPDPDPDPLNGDLETARLMAEIHLRSSELKVLDSRVLGALEKQRGLLKNEIDRATTPVSDAAMRYMEAESGPGPDRLDVVL